MYLHIPPFCLLLGISPQFSVLLKQVRRAQRHAFSTGSSSNLRTQFRNYFAFCLYFERTPLPADLDTICGYALFLSRSVVYPVISNYLSGVKMLHILMGYPYPFTGNAILHLVLRGIHRLHPYTPRRAPIITPVMLSQLHAVVDHQNSLESAVYACALFLFFTISRLGSMLPSSSKSKSGSFVSVDRVNLCDSGVVVSFLHTKTIQFGERILHIPLLRTHSPLCPMAAYLHSRFFVASHPPSAAAFTHKSDGVVHPLYASKFVAVVRTLLGRAGVADASSFRGHSFWRGGASWAFNNGVPGELIQVMGDWKSDAYKVYLEFSMSSKLLIAERLATALPGYS